MLCERNIKVIQPTAAISEAERKIQTAAYCRVSTDSDDQANSFLAQVNYYNSFISSRDDMVLVDIYADEGITGTCLSKRDELKRLIHDCSLGRIDRVLCKSVSRLARNSLECLETIRLLKEYGVSVYFENDNIDTKTMNSEMILYVKSAFAQSEALACSTRVSTAIRMKMESGEFVTTTAPYGYRLKNGNLVIVPEEAETIKHIFDLYLSGNGINTIATMLNKESVFTDGRHWENSAVRYVLTNEKYIGDTIAQKTYTPQVFPLQSKRNNGQRDKYYIANTHPAIISKDVFETVGRFLKSKAINAEQKLCRHLFSQKIVCANCGWSYRRKVTNNKVYWFCARQGRSGNECDSHQYHEDYIKEIFVRMYNNLRQYETVIIDTTIAQLAELRSKRAAGNSEISAIDSEIVKLSEQNDRYERFRAKQIMDEISFREQTDRLRKRLTELRSRRLKLAKDSEEEAVLVGIRELKETLADFPPVLIDFSADAFTATVDKIRVESNGDFTFILKGGIELTEKTESK